MKRLILILLLPFLLKANAYGFWELPPLPPPSQYGNLLINRMSEKSGIQAVTFSHWSHRVHYTCRVCHFELDFQMKTNTTEITEEENKKGRFCGACHNGKIAFGHTEDNCKKCHNGDINYGKEKFETLSKTLPLHDYGNKINWTKAVKSKMINPKQTILDEPYNPVPFSKRISLEAEWSLVPPAYFPHEEHNYWLDCANCHPDIFNIKKKTTKHFSMVYILEGKFCGVCHIKVAFPMDDCKGCHPDMTKY